MKKKIATLRRSLANEYRFLRRQQAIAWLSGVVDTMRPEDYTAYSFEPWHKVCARFDQQFGVIYMMKSAGVL